MKQLKIVCIETGDLATHVRPVQSAHASEGSQRYLEQCLFLIKQDRKLFIFIICITSYLDKKAIAYLMSLGYVFSYGNQSAGGATQIMVPLKRRKVTTEQTPGYDSKACKFPHIAVFILERKMGTSRKSFLTRLGRSKGFLIQESYRQNSRNNPPVSHAWLMFFIYNKRISCMSFALAAPPPRTWSLKTTLGMRLTLGLRNRKQKEKPQPTRLICWTSVG